LAKVLLYRLEPESWLAPKGAADGIVASLRGMLAAAGTSAGIQERDASTPVPIGLDRQELGREFEVQRRKGGKGAAAAGSPRGQSGGDVATVELLGWDMTGALFPSQHGFHGCVLGPGDLRSRW
jgi:hypothetical protein